MKPQDDRFVLHEGLTELEQMKLEMFRTVVRNVFRVVLVTFSMIFIGLLLRALAGALSHRI